MKFELISQTPLPEFQLYPPTVSGVIIRFVSGDRSKVKLVCKTVSDMSQGIITEQYGMDTDKRKKKNVARDARKNERPFCFTGIVCTTKMYTKP